MAISTKTILRSMCVLVVWFTSGAADAQGVKKGADPGQFDFYILALSWSPAYCADGGTKRSPDQCDITKKNGFVVHGLWPQSETGYPLSCATDFKDLPKATLEQAAGIFPDLGLANNEWRRHGSCSGLSPQAYIDLVEAAKKRVIIPDLFDPQNMRREERLAPADIERRFSDANPSLQSTMMSVACRKAVLREVRICFTKELKEFRACPEIDRSGCRAEQITITSTP